jgi:hypothetical protein
MNRQLVAFIALGISCVIAGITIGMSIDSEPSANQPKSQNAEDSVVVLASDNTVSKPVIPRVEQNEQLPLGAKSKIDSLIVHENVLKRISGAVELAATASEMNILVLLDTLVVVGDDPNNMSISRIFYLRYLNLNPLAAVTHFNEKFAEPTKGQKSVMYDMYHEWAWIDMYETLNYVTITAPEKDRQWIIHYLLDDPHFVNDKTLLEVANSFSDSTRTMALKALYKDETPEQLFERMLTMNVDEKTRNRELTRLLKEWAKQDPRAALQRLSQLDSENKERLISSLLQSWARSAPEDALASVIELDLDGKHAKAILSAVARTDGEKALTLYKQFSEHLDSSVKDRLLATWARAEPQAMAAYLDQHPDEKLKGRSVKSRLAYNYSRKDPKGAFEWASRNNLFDDSPSAGPLAKALVNHDIDDAQLTYEQMQPGKARDHLFSALVEKKTDADLKTGEKWLEEHKDDPGYKAAQQAFYLSWAKKDPLAAVRGALSIEDGMQKMQLVGMIMYTWHRNDPNGAINWAAGLSKGEMRDVAVSSLVMTLSRTNKEKALELVTLISDDNKRDPLLKFLNR